MTVICLNLTDGTVVVGKEIENDDDEMIVLENVLMLSTQSYNNMGTQVFLTKYNIFGEETEMVFNPYTVITKYKASRYIRTFYRQFLEKSKKQKEENSTNDTEVMGDGKTILNEFESVLGNKKVDIEDLRKTVHTLDETETDEDEVEEDFEDDDFPSDEDDEDKSN